MLTIAYLGNGKSTNRYHLPFSTKLQDKIKVKTIYSPSGKLTWPTLEGVHYTSDLEDIYRDPEIQLVVVTTPSHLHYELGKDVLLHGKNVLIEKPFTETSAQAKELFALAQEKGLFVQCYHTLDQVISYFGQPDDVHYEVRQLLGKNRMNDYFDLDLFYGRMKVSVKSSYFRLKERPSFVVYGENGVFVKQTKDRQEEHLKQFYLPDHADFGIDLPEHYGTLTYMDANGNYHEEKVISEIGDYSRVYEGVYETIIHGKEKIVKDEETILQIEMVETGINQVITES